MTDLLSFADIPADSASLVGGKALSLGRLAAAGLPVPPGVVLTTAVHRRLRGRRLADDPLAAVLLRRCQYLGGPVAVRSSATAEDGALVSFAGQQDTILGVESEALVDAVERCWASLDGERAIAYRRSHGLSDDLAMAVVVQQMVPAEVAGVLFTRDPLDPDGKRMLVEAALGLGESVVSGKMMPDRFHLDPESGAVLDCHIAEKTLRIGAAGEEPVPVELRTRPCLDETQLRELADLGRRVEALYGEARDIEFAFAAGRFWLLQARPITAGGLAEARRLRDEEIAALRASADPRGTVWSRFNLAEVLPAPTPMSWALARRLMSGRGGFGLMVRDLGFQPDPALDDTCAFDLICGRPFCNLSREPRMLYSFLPFEHSFADLKADPRKAFYPVPAIRYRRLPWYSWLLAPVLLPRAVALFARNGMRQRRLLQHFAADYRSRIAPRFRDDMANSEREDLSQLASEGLLLFFDWVCQRTLVDFARESLKPTALAALALTELEGVLSEVMPTEKAAELARRLAVGARPDPDADLATAVRDLARGDLSREAFLQRFGHRAGEEMELSRPRWSEEPTTLTAAAHSGHQTEPLLPAERLARETNLTAEQRELILPSVAVLHDYVGLRESAKNDLMRGYALLRRVLLELDRRHGLHGGIFFLEPTELPDLIAGKDLQTLVIQRRRRRAMVLGIDVPAVLFSDDLEAIGRTPAPVAGAEVLHGVALSPGVAEGLALVLEHPVASADVAGGDYILVCPTTDPAWVPLFVRARGLVMETGGVLSHGAIVARELGVPAVAGLPGIVQRLRTGQRVRVDGSQGTLCCVE